MDINFSYFFTPDKFPWAIMNSDRPCYGPSYSYVCKLVAQYAGQDACFLRGKPALFEMAKYPDTSMVYDIYKYFVALEEVRDPYNRVSTTQEVLDFLRHHTEFKADLEKRLIIAHYKGDTLPEAAVYYSKREY